MAKPKKQFLVEKTGSELLVYAVALTEALNIARKQEGVRTVSVGNDVLIVFANPIYDINEIKAEIEQKLAGGSETVPEVFNE